ATSAGTGCMALLRAFARALPGGEAVGRSRGARGPREAFSLDDQTRVRRFESFFVPHLDAAYNFARWLTRDERNAEDVGQEACLRHVLGVALVAREPAGEVEGRVEVRYEKALEAP